MQEACGQQQGLLPGAYTCNAHWQCTLCIGKAFQPAGNAWGRDYPMVGEALARGDAYLQKRSVPE